MRLNGADMTAGPVLLLDDGRTHLVEVTLGEKSGVPDNAHSSAARS
jgi:hypothetical protein